MIKAASGSKRSRVFSKTAHLVENGPACRVYGSMAVKKVTGNLHIVNPFPSLSLLVSFSTEEEREKIDDFGTWIHFL